MSRQFRTDALKPFKAVMNRAIRETVRAFFADPRQFRGEIGVMHFLYHQILTHGERVVVQRSNQQTTLLLQCQHYTALPYRSGGGKERSDRFGLAIIDPHGIPESGDVRKSPVIAAVEVGRNKTVAEMGDFAAGESARNVKPGDAAKLIREMEFCGLPLAYLVELYDDPARAVLAQQVFAAATEEADEAGLSDFHLIVGVRTSGSSAKIAVYPSEWRSDLRIVYPTLSE